jgi:hypothetical protein
MRRAWGSIAVSLVALAAANVQGSVIITEIMYNSAGSGDGVVQPEPCSEWVEIYNAGATPVDIGGWKLDDEDNAAWGALPDGSVLQPGEIAIIANMAVEFAQFWGVSAQVFGVQWGSLANSATATNEILVLLDGDDNIVDSANYEVASNDWPASTNGRSIYLKDVSLDNDLGANWAQSAEGVDGAYKPASAVAPYAVGDVGSPGHVVPEPITLVLLVLGFAGMGRARFRTR